MKELLKDNQHIEYFETENKALEHLHAIQGQSWKYAFKYSGYKIIEAETITRINGNGKPYTVTLPKLVMLSNINDVALAHITDNTGLVFERNGSTLEAQPTTSKQIATLFLTYNFKTKYYNNGSHKNTVFLKSDHHQGFDVDSICYDCARYNHLVLPGLKQGDRLAC